MSIIRSSDPSSGIDKIEYRNSLYYDSYQYKAQFKLLGFRYVKWYSTDCTQDEFIDKIKSTPDFYLKPPKKREIIGNIDILFSFLEWKEKESANIKILNNDNNIFVYCNDLNLIKELSALDVNQKLVITYTKAETGIFSGKKYLKHDPTHKFRVHFTSGYITSEVKQTIKEFLNDNSEIFNISNSLDSWLSMDYYTSYSWRRNWISSSYYVDYNDENDLAYLSLMHGTLLGKRYSLHKKEAMTNDPTVAWVDESDSITS